MLSLKSMKETFKRFLDGADERECCEKDPEAFFLKNIVQSGKSGAIIEKNHEAMFHYDFYLFNKEGVREIFPFDSSRGTGKAMQLGGTQAKPCPPTSCRLDTGNLSPMLKFGLKSMEIGERSLFVLSSHFAFGEKGLQPTPEIPQGVPPGAPIFMALELIGSVKDDMVQAALKYAIDPKDRNMLTLDEIYEIAAANLKLGNSNFVAKHFTLAIKYYERGLSFIIGSRLGVGETLINFYKILLTLYSNLCASYLQMVAKDLEFDPNAKGSVFVKTALKYGSKGLTVPFEAIKDKEEIAKLYFRVATCHFRLGNNEKAEELVVEASKYDKSNAKIRQLSSDIQKRKIVLYNELEKMKTGPLLPKITELLKKQKTQ